MTSKITFRFTADVTVKGMFRLTNDGDVPVTYEGPWRTVMNPGDTLEVQMCGQYQELKGTESDE